MQTLQNQEHVLYVAWQDSTSRRYYPVARLVSDGDDNGVNYTFVYIRGAEEAKAVGFEPFKAFPSLSNVYRSGELFPFFSNRLMSKSRPDYASYIESLGLSPATDPMVILARSGGARATDSVELFALPNSNGENGGFRLFFWMHGFRHLPAEGQDRVLSLRNGEELFALRQPDNVDDPHAIQLLSSDQIAVGYVPRYLTNGPVSLFDSGNRLFVERVNPPPALSQQRLLCRVEGSGKIEIQNDAYQPIVG